MKTTPLIPTSEIRLTHSISMSITYSGKDIGWFMFRAIGERENVMKITNKFYLYYMNPDSSEFTKTRYDWRLYDGLEPLAVPYKPGMLCNYKWLGTRYGLQNDSVAWIQDIWVVLGDEKFKDKDECVVM